MHWAKTQNRNQTKDMKDFEMQDQSEAPGKALRCRIPRVPSLKLGRSKEEKKD